MGGDMIMMTAETAVSTKHLAVIVYGLTKLTVT